MIDAEQIAAWRAKSAEAMISGLDEYCPPEFTELLDAYEALVAKLENIPNDR